MNKGKFAVLLLAAGSSARMGQSKQLLDAGGEPLLCKAANVAIASGIGPITVVLGANERTHRELITGYPVNIIYNRSWEKGMGNSLKAGLHHLIQHEPGLEGIVVMVCDQPFVTAGHLSNLLAAHDQTRKPIIASGYANTAGVPAFFGEKYFRQLLRLPDTQGARKIIAEHDDDVSVIDFPPGETDLDTPEDYQLFLQKKSSL